MLVGAAFAFGSRRPAACLARSLFAAEPDLLPLAEVDTNHQEVQTQNQLDEHTSIGLPLSLIRSTCNDGFASRVSYRSRSEVLLKHHEG